MERDRLKDREEQKKNIFIIDFQTHLSMPRKWQEQKEVAVKGHYRESK